MLNNCLFSFWMPCPFSRGNHLYSSLSRAWHTRRPTHTHTLHPVRSFVARIGTVRGLCCSEQRVAHLDRHFGFFFLKRVFIITLKADKRSQKTDYWRHQFTLTAKLIRQQEHRALHARQDSRHKA